MENESFARSINMKYFFVFSLFVCLPNCVSAQNIPQKLEGAYQWDKVNISVDEIDTKKFFKIDLITTKATAPWGFSSVSNTQNRALRKLKMAAALLGGNTVNLKFDVINTIGIILPLSRTQVVGSVYCSQLVDTVKFKKFVESNKELTLVSKIGMRNSDANIHTSQTNSETVFIDSYKFENGFIFLDLSMQKKKGPKYQFQATNKNRDKIRVIDVSDGQILVAYKERNSIYNLLIVRK